MKIQKTASVLAIPLAALFFMAQGALAQAAGESAQGQQLRDQAAEGTLDSQYGQPIEAEDRGEYEQTVEQATQVFKDITSAPEENIPPQILDQAQAIAIIPDLVKAGIIAGGRHGTGVMMTRQGDSWSPPIFVSISGASLGAQLGVTSSDVVLVFNNQENINQLLEGDDFTLGVDAIVAAGPAGAAARATTQDAEVYSYKRTEGLFAGVSLTGGVLTADQSATMAYYNIDPQQARGYYGDETKMMRSIVGAQEGNGRDFIGNVPQSAQQLQDVLSRYLQHSGNQQS